MCAFFARSSGLAIELSERRLLPLRSCRSSTRRIRSSRRWSEDAIARYGPRAYHDHALELITSSPTARQIGIPIPATRVVISSL